MQYREIELIAASIRNGRIYFPSSDLKFFPTDSLSDRSRNGHKGKDVTFRAGDYEFTGPIRICSGKRISPQRSFAKYLKAVGAQTGDKLLVYRVKADLYNVVHKPSDNTNARLCIE